MNQEEEFRVVPSDNTIISRVGIEMIPWNGIQICTVLQITDPRRGGDCSRFRTSPI